MTNRFFLFLLLFTMIFSGLYAQFRSGQDDGDAALQYVFWAQNEIDNNRWGNALIGLERAADFANVSSDISYLLALARSHEGKNIRTIIESLDRSIEVNRWVFYNVNQALLLKAEKLIVLRNYSTAISILDRIPESADSSVQRLLALKGLGLNSSGGNVDPAQALVRFRSRLLETMDRYPRDPRPLRIFLEYARQTNPNNSQMAVSDFNLLELVLRRLPFVLDADPELGWMAARFIRDVETARLHVSSYRASKKNIPPGHGSIPIALNLGLIDDAQAAEEFFPAGSGELVLSKDIITETYNLLRSEAGRELFSQKLLSFSGIITADDDNDGHIDTRVFYSAGVVREITFDLLQDGDADLRIFFGTDGIPQSAEYLISGQPALIKWERYPSVGQVELGTEKYLFRPADFQFAPVAFIDLGGSRSRTGLNYPVMQNQYIGLTRRSLISFCVSMSRPSIEFKGAVEEIFFFQGIPQRAVEILNGKQVSLMVFERGFPVIQYVDFDLDGRMETIRRFRFPVYQDQFIEETFNYRDFIISTESDWTGEGIYKTGEVYLQDGSVVIIMDMDGSGTPSEIRTGNDQ